MWGEANKEAVHQIPDKNFLVHEESGDSLDYLVFFSLPSRGRGAVNDGKASTNGHGCLSSL
jgi:hypothetical protein